ncbi:M12 family metallo-peptidase [Sinomicrobium kalidii]|uniref:zinc-dependent metalloprotease n=1 Tax=Sinomicrobium kalidii TaxID=2900738 RepID=UPI001E3A0FE0|nr:zinc-dependent metalloprotease [Sinomicrobium kalidii]UGU15595.1 M12 family metallo-peptidase [Sinomicrobium kalidii]
MRKRLLILIFLFSLWYGYGQDAFWSAAQRPGKSKVLAAKQALSYGKIYKLNVKGMKQALQKVPQRNRTGTRTGVVIRFPNAEGEMERFRVVEASVMHPELAAKYPGIRSYAGQGVDDPSMVIRFSISHLGLQSMRLSSGKGTVFIEPYTSDRTHYTVYDRKDREAPLEPFECTVKDEMTKGVADIQARPNADDGVLRTFRLAVSAPGEYTQYFGGTKADALAAINATITRVNGIYEVDFGVTMQLIANTDDVIYTNASTDPYTGSYNSQLQSTLSSTIGEANYDIGHLLQRGSNNGNAGCIGCVCVDNQKGSGFSSHSTPEGDNFDVDYVAHEIGHQFGGNHTFTIRNEGTDAHFEPGSGSTIMGYAGITGGTDVQSHSDPYFHAFTVEQITNYVKSTSCQTETATGNNVPTADAGSDITIPKGTPFILTGAGTDADAGDELTYCWEQMDENNAAHTYPSATATSGVAFRSMLPSTSEERYFPALSTVLSGSTSSQWEVVPDVGRILNFRLTVRDNRAGGGANNSDDMVVTVDGNSGPFVVTSPNSNINWQIGTTETVTWNVAGTTGAPVNCQNVNILLSTDGGNTFPVTLASGVANTGSADITVPDNAGNQNRIRIEASNNIFYDISNTNFTISDEPGGGDDNNVRLTLTFDNYPEETSWEVLDEGGQIVLSGGTYGSEPDGSTLVTEEFLADGCYSFVIKDVYGDGMCCSYGNGSYTLTDIETGDTLASGGSFTEEEATDFCIGTTTPPPGASDVELSLTFDNYPEETSWEILDESSSVVAQGGTYDDEPDGSTLAVSQSLADGCYTFVIRDSYGDGICCSYGNGSYSLTNTETGEVLASGSSFNASESTDFCVGGSSTAKDSRITVAAEGRGEASPEIGVTLYPNPARGSLLHIERPGKKIKYSIIDLSGRMVDKGVLQNNAVRIDKLLPGVYFIQLYSDTEKMTKRFIRK